MQVSGTGQKGISPIIAVLILIAVTLVVAGAAMIWIFGFSNVTEGDNGGGKIYIFDVDLDGNGDLLIISMISGEDLNTSRMKITIDDNELEVSPGEITAGNEFSIDSNEDLDIGTYYNVKIIISNKVHFDNDIIASP